MMFEVLFCVDTGTVTVMLCDSFIFGSLAIWVTDETELLFLVCITALCYKKTTQMTLPTHCRQKERNVC